MKACNCTCECHRREISIDLKNAAVNAEQVAQEINNLLGRQSRSES